MGKEKELQGWIKEARERLWSAEHIRKNDKKLPGESQDHWEKRRLRNRERVERRQEVLDNLVKKLEHLRKHKEEIKETNSGTGTTAIGFSTWEGKTVAAWMVHWLDESKKHGWVGTVVSGVRTPEYSEQLCYNMCDHPTCPGLCAGRNSNHNMVASQGYPFGAIDVSDYDNFERIQFQIGSPLRNDLPIDPVHFSVSGH